MCEQINSGLVFVIIYNNNNNNIYIIIYYYIYYNFQRMTLNYQLYCNYSKLIYNK